MRTDTVFRRGISRYLTMAAVCLAFSGVFEKAQARGFVLIAYAYLDEDRTPSVRVVAEISNPNLVFFKYEDGFRARYEVSVSVREQSKKKVVKTAVIQGDVFTDEYEQTTLRESKNRPSRSFPLVPGEYKIEATLAVKNTHITASRAVDVVVPDFLASGIGFSTPVVLSVPARNVHPITRWKEFAAGGGARVVDQVDQTLTIFDKQPAVKFSIYLEERTPARVACDVFFEVLDLAKERTMYGKRNLELTGVDDDFLLTFDVDDWEPGPYTVNLRVVTEDRGREATTSVRFNVDVTRAMLGAFFDETMGMLSLIASSGELEDLKNAPEEDRPNEWSKFWNRRDPDPATARNEALEEYLTRVRVVTERFSGLAPGWRTDRGRTYIQYGAPEYVERVSDPQYRGEYEIWRYYSLNRVFVFYDMFGLGDFRLVEEDLF